MQQEELNKILDEHKKWLTTNGKEGCKARLFKADLCNVNLQYADLRYADLRYANLIYSDLSDADLRYTDLSHALLCHAYLRYAKLSYAKLYYADLIHAKLSHADLRYTDLNCADLDYAVFPLWCGGLDVNIDDRQATQLLYHLIRNVNYSKNCSESIKKLLNTASLVKQANKFHRIDECGIIKEDK